MDAMGGFRVEGGAQTLATHTLWKLPCCQSEEALSPKPATNQCRFRSPQEALPEGLNSGAPHKQSLANGAAAKMHLICPRTSSNNGRVPSLKRFPLNFLPCSPLLPCLLPVCQRHFLEAAPTQLNEFGAGLRSRLRGFLVCSQ